MNDIPAAQARLSPGEVARYRAEGYVVPRWRLPPAKLAFLRAALDRLLADNPTIRPEKLISAHIRKGPENTRGNDAFLEFAHDPDLLDIVAQVLGPDIILWGCQVFCKPAGDGMEVPMHQDGRYWPIRPLATCTAWIAIDDSRPENGCMRVIPGSHRQGHVYAHRKDTRPDLALDLVLEDGQLDPSAAHDVELEAGQFSLHDVYLVHGSNPNRSTRRRAGVAIRYMPASSLFDRTLMQRQTRNEGYVVDFTTRPIWLVRGQDQAGNDFQVGKC
ncbi:MAG: phytanoyl-CoA dioxygenase family protein [Alphaproteobacteria bacterium]|nr:phytanoyl-CoA dioxygenase family protein [Alphaproteobacteria bacterium]